MSTILFGLDPRDRATFENLYKANKGLAKELKIGGDSASKAITNAFNIGSAFTAKKLQKSAQELSGAINEQFDELQKLEKELQKTEKKAAEDIRKADNEDAKNNIRQNLEASRKQLRESIAKQKALSDFVLNRAQRQFDKQNGREIARIEEQQKLLKESQESSAKLFRTKIQEGGELAGQALTNALSFSQEDFVKLISFSAEKVATKVSQAAAAGKEALAARKEGGGEGVLGGVLSLLTRMGPLVAGLTAAFAGFAAIAFAADGQIREFNKTILDAAPAVDLFGKTVFDSGFNLKTSLKEVRDAAVSFSNITKVSAQDALNLITKFNDSGIALNQLRSEFSKTGSATEAYTEMAMFANTYTRALGISVDDLTTQFSFMFGKMGMGLDSIKGSFAAITAGAQVAGLNVKDFFTAVSQTTSGLALYNIRLDKTATQLLGLMKIMDKQKAQELLESKEMGNQGIEERFKAGMLVGGRGQKIFQAALKDQMANFTKDYSETFAETLGEIDMSKLAQMSGKELGGLQQALIAEGSRKGLAPEQAAMAGQRLEKLRKVAQGAQGGTMDMAKGMSGLSGLSDVAMRLTQGMSLVGAQSLDEMGYIARKNFEDLSGISGERFDEMASLLNRYQAQFPKDTIPQILERMASGEVPMTEADKKLLDEISKQKPKSMEQLAQDQINATTSITDILKNKIAGLLESIGSSLSEIFDGFAESGLFDFDDSKKNREERLGVEEEVKNAKETSGSLGESIRALESTLAAEMAKPESKERDAAVEGLGKILDTLKAQKAVADKRKEIAEKTLEGMGKGLSKANAEAGVLGVAPSQAAPGFGEAMGAAAKAVLFIPSEPTRTEEKVLKENEAIKDIALKKSADDTIAQKKQQEFNKENEKQNDAIIKAMDRAEARKDLDQLLPGLLAEAETGKTDRLKAALQADPSLAGLINRTGVNLQDFIYRGDGTRGTINPINKRDEFFGAKPGGAIDKAINGGGGGVVNIYISGDEAKVYNVVKRVIQESGLRAPAGGR